MKPISNNKIYCRIWNIWRYEASCRRACTVGIEEWQGALGWGPRYWHKRIGSVCRIQFRI